LKVAKATHKLLKIGQIKPRLKNVKKHPSWQIEKLVKIIDKYDYLQNIVVDEKNTIIIGHGRLIALKELGVDEIEVTVKEGLTEDEKLSLAIADNKIISNEWDEQLLAKELPKLQKKGLETGFNEKEIKDLKYKIQNANKEIEEPAFPLSPRLNEKYDYILMFFTDELDFKYASQLLKLPMVKDRIKHHEVGTCRAIPGMQAIKKIQKAQVMD